MLRFGGSNQAFLMMIGEQSMNVSANKASQLWESEIPKCADGLPENTVPEGTAFWGDIPAVADGLPVSYVSQFV